MQTAICGHQLIFPQPNRLNLIVTLLKSDRKVGPLWQVFKKGLQLLLDSWKLPSLERRYSDVKKWRVFSAAKPNGTKLFVQP